MKKRKICFVITSTIHYSRSILILKELALRKNVTLQIIVGASALLPYYGDVVSLLRRDGFQCNAKIMMTFEGGNTLAMAKTTGIGVSEFATAFDNLGTDVVIIRGDRYEVLSAAIAAAYLNIPVAHIEGGDVTGTIDESVRHAVTKLSHIHFPTNEKAKERILRMGEDPRYIFNVGCPEVEYLAIAKNRFRTPNKIVNYLGVGKAVDIHESYVVVMQHPITSEVGKNKKHIKETLRAMYELQIPTIWFWPNVDAGTDEVSKGIRSFRENYNLRRIRFIKYLPPEEFIGLLKRAACLVGNSSSGVKECSYLGTPVVNIGTRQDGRTRADNIIDVPYKRDAIKRAVIQQIKHGKYAQSMIYYQKDTSKKIVDIVASIDLYTQKRFID